MCHPVIPVLQLVAVIFCSFAMFALNLNKECINEAAQKILYNLSAFGREMKRVLALGAWMMKYTINVHHSTCVLVLPFLK